MVTDNELACIIKEKLPEIEVNEIEESQNRVFAIMNNFTEYTINLIRNKNWEGLKVCFKVASLIYHKGNQAVKKAVENIFMFRLILKLEQPEEREIFFKMMPPALRYIQNKQSVLSI